MRKELLLGTTALLVGAIAAPDMAAAEDPLRLGIGGYKNEYFGLGSFDDDVNTDYGATSHFSDGEVFFKGETKLDNGLTVGVQIELEAFQSGDQIDEAYSFIEGDFGRVIIGAQNTAPYLTFWGVTAPVVGVPINSGWITVWTPLPTGYTGGFLSTGLTTNLDLSDDAFGFSYLSPRFSGFQFVASYQPTAAPNNGDPKNAPGVNNDTEITNIFAVGVNFEDSFNGVDVGFAAGYNHGTVSDNAKANGADDPQQVKVGVKVGVSGFSIAGSYANQLDGATNAANTTSNEGQAYDVGVSYLTGPWGVSVTYFHGEQEGVIATGGDDEADSIVGAVSYALGPGITTSLSIYHGKFEDEGGAEGKSTLGILGLNINF